MNFVTEKWWKGQPVKSLFLATDEARSDDGMGTSSSCDYHFKEGETYIVYATEKDGVFKTYACSRTRPLKLTEDLKFLGDGVEVTKEKDGLLLSLAAALAFWGVGPTS